MPFHYLVAPQWQGSGSSRAMRLVDGAEAIRGDLPSAVTTVIDVPLGAGDAQNTGVHRASSVLTVRERVATAIAGIADPVVIIGGDCGVEFGAIEAVAEDHVAVVWFDAHPDLNTPQSSPSGAFTGMVVRALVGDLEAPFVPTTAVSPDRLVFVGTRATDDEEERYLEANSVRVLPPEAATAQSIVDAVAATGATAVYLHVDLDVLDPGEILGLADPVPFGLTTETLLTSLRALAERFDVVGAGITAFAPATPMDAGDDAGSILRILAALRRR